MKNEEVAFKTLEIYDKTIFFCWIFKDLDFYKSLIFSTGVIFLSQFNYNREVILNWAF